MSELSRDSVQRARQGVLPGVDLDPATTEGWHQLCLELALEAGATVRAARHRSLNDKTSFKEDRSPTTTLELGVEQAMRAHLLAFDPTAVFVGEETGGELPEEGMAVAVDPIDGTWAFLGRTESIATSVTVFRDRQVIAAAVSNPATAEVIHASLTQPAELVQLSAFGEDDAVVALPLERRQGDRPLLNLQPSRDVALVSSLTRAWSDRVLGTVRSPGGSPAWSLAAAALGTFTYVNTWGPHGSAPHDLAGGVFLLRSAGGEVSNRRGEPIDPLTHRGLFVASLDRAAAQTLLALLPSESAPSPRSDAMSTDPPDSMATFLAEQGLSPDTSLYRATLPEFLSQAEDGSTRISAHPDAGEAVVDIHHSGHTLVANQFGPGIALSITRDNEWVDDDRVLVEVRLADVLDQGGVVYPVVSVIADTVFYCTLPTGSVTVRVLDEA